MGPLLPPVLREPRSGVSSSCLDSPCFRVEVRSTLEVSAWSQGGTPTQALRGRLSGLLALCLWAVAVTPAWCPVSAALGAAVGAAWEGGGELAAGYTWTWRHSGFIFRLR